MNLLQSLTAKSAMTAKEKKSLTAKDARGTIARSIPRKNAKTTLSMEWPQYGCGVVWVWF